jgi:hypothetical protein
MKGENIHYYFTISKEMSTFLDFYKAQSDLKHDINRVPNRDQRENEAKMPILASCSTIKIRKLSNHHRLF